MPGPKELRAAAQELYQLAQMIADADVRLPCVLRALELEFDADALEREQNGSPASHVIDQRVGGGNRETPQEN